MSIDVGQRMKMITQYISVDPKGKLSEEDLRFRIDCLGACPERTRKLASFFSTSHARECRRHKNCRPRKGRRNRTCGGLSRLRPALCRSQHIVDDERRRPPRLAAIPLRPRQPLTFTCRRPIFPQNRPADAEELQDHVEAIDAASDLKAIGERPGRPRRLCRRRRASCR